MNRKEFRRRLINYYVHPEMFLLPVKKKVETTYQLTVYKVTPYYYDIKKHEYSNESTNAIKGCIVIINEKDEVVYLSDRPDVINSNWSQTYVTISVPKGKYKIKYLFCLEAFDDVYEEIEVNGDTDVYLYSNPLPPIVTKQQIVAHEDEVKYDTVGELIPGTDVKITSHTAALSTTYIDGQTSIISHRLRPLNKLIIPISNAYTTKSRGSIVMTGVSGAGINIIDAWENYFKYFGGMYYNNAHLSKVNSSVTNSNMGHWYLERYSQWDIDINIAGYLNYTFKMTSLNDQDVLIYGGNRYYKVSGDNNGVNGPYVNRVEIYKQMYSNFSMYSTQIEGIIGWDKINAAGDSYVDPPSSSGDYNRSDTVYRGLSKATISNIPAISSILNEAEKAVGYDILGFDESGQYDYDYYMKNFSIYGTRYLYTVSMINTYVRFYTYVDPINNVMYNNAHIESPDVTYPASYFSTNYTNVLNVDVIDSDLIYHYFIGMDENNEYIYYLSDAQINSWKQDNPNGTIVGEYEYRLPAIDRSVLPDLDKIEKCKERFGSISNGFFTVPVLLLKVDKHNMRAGAYLADEEVFYTIYRRTSPTFSDEYDKFYKEEIL